MALTIQKCSAGCVTLVISNNNEMSEDYLLCIHHLAPLYFS